MASRHIATPVPELQEKRTAFRSKLTKTKPRISTGGYGACRGYVAFLAIGI